MQGRPAFFYGGAGMLSRRPSSPTEESNIANFVQWDMIVSQKRALEKGVLALQFEFKMNNVLSIQNALWL